MIDSPVVGSATLRAGLRARAAAGARRVFFKGAAASASSSSSRSSSDSRLDNSAEKEASEPLLRFFGGGLMLSSISGVCEPAPLLFVALEEAALRANRASEDRVDLVVRRGGEAEPAACFRRLAVSFDIRDVRIVEDGSGQSLAGHVVEDLCHGIAGLGGKNEQSRGLIESVNPRIWEIRGRGLQEDGAAIVRLHAGPCLVFVSNIEKMYAGVMSVIYMP